MRVNPFESVQLMSSVNVTKVEWFMYVVTALPYTRNLAHAGSRMRSSPLLSQVDCPTGRGLSNGCKL
jgi:hypothetical protein